MGLALTTYTETALLQARLHLSTENRTELVDPVVVCQLGGGLLKFAESIFPNVASSDLHGELIERQTEGIGPHFDVYEELVDQKYPWIGVFNLAGKVSLRATYLSTELTADYKMRFPEATNEAYDARRGYANLALLQADADAVATIDIEPNMGFILPQLHEAQAAVHEVTPLDPENAGLFVKVLKISDSPRAKELADSNELVSLDTVVTNVVAGRHQTQSLPPLTATEPHPTVPERQLTPRRRRPARGRKLD